LSTSADRRLAFRVHDRNFQRDGVDPSFLPSFEGQGDTRFAGTGCFGDLDQVLKAVASTPLLERDCSVQTVADGLLARECELALRIGVGRDRVGIKHECERAWPVTRCPDAEL
jgi:hypothetical protein